MITGTAQTSINTDLLVARYLTNGVLDTTFNNTGYKLLDFVQTNDKGTDLYIQSNGSILVTGRIQRTDDHTVGVVVVRLFSDGTLDTQFGSGGNFRIPTARGKDANAAIYQLSSGEIALAWYRSSDESEYFTQVTKLLSQGTVDSSFGTNGTLTTSIRGIHGHRPGFAIQKDHKLVIGGTVPNSGNADLALERRW